MRVVLNVAEKPMVAREPVDYNNIPMSRFVQKADVAHFDDVGIFNLVKGVLAEKQMPIPASLNHTPQSDNPLQLGIIQNLKQNNHPVPAALR